MSIKIKWVALTMTFLFGIGVVAAAFIIGANSLLFHFGYVGSKTSDNLIYAGSVVFDFGLVALAGLAAVGVAIVIRFVVIVIYVAYVWLLMTIFGDQALKSSRRHA
jgi:hypothetical protein